MNESPSDTLQLQGYACHEAGHCVAQYHFGLELVWVSIRDQGEGKGGVAQARGQNPVILENMGVYREGTPERSRFISNLIIMSLAGEVAQTEYCAESVEPHHAALDQIKINHLIERWSRNELQSMSLESLQDMHADCLEALREDIREEMPKATVEAKLHELKTEWLQRKGQEKLEELYGETRELLIRPKYAVAVHLLAQALMEHKELAGSQVTEIIRKAIAEKSSQ